MHTSVKSSVIASLFALVVVSMPALAEDKMLSADELKKVIVGNTIHASMVNDGKTFKAYFDSRGKYTRIQDGATTEGTYRISADGTQCVMFNNAETCAKIKDNGNNTYTRIENGVPKATWNKVVAGKDL
ncbi:MAG: hypothetical protein HY080_13730 [Gammaproteobacteria bacterium]|nr:hypothetical protein [Gammaproteobacteria bacterium]